MSKEDGKAARIAALKAAASAKQKRASESLDAAISKMVKKKAVISFASVAKEAGISVSYLYKYPEVKARITELRNKQSLVAKTTKPTASDASRAVIVGQLKGRIKDLEAEIVELRKANQAMAGKLYQLQGAKDLAEMLQVENEGLREQLRGSGKLAQ
jgi:SepF-like predicted cell division protein (DUF552 family)